MKRFQCSRCDYATNRKADLDRHTTRKHPPASEEKKFKCSSCDYATTVVALGNGVVRLQGADALSDAYSACCRCGFA